MTEDAERRAIFEAMKPRCYLCKQLLPGGMYEVLEIDNAIGENLQRWERLCLDPRLEGVTDAQPDELFHQEPKEHPESHDIIVCVRCALKYLDPTEGA
jgi:hypothetical protein